MELVIPAPARFNFRRTVLSHGWSLLPPFELDRQSWVLRRVLSVPGRRPMVAAFREAGRGVAVAIEPARLSARAVGELAHQTVTIFGLDVNLEPFYKVAARQPDMRWVGRDGAGRLLRSPTVFEDVIKLILSTNCPWSATRQMVHALVEMGEPTAGGRRAFPPPAVVALAAEQRLRETGRAGYRAPAVAAVAEAVASGTEDIEAWVRLPAAEVRRRARRLKGVSPYVIDNLLGLLGHGRGLGLDSWVRSVLAERAGRELSDREIAERYESFGEHAGLALWCDVTRDVVEHPSVQAPVV